MLELLEIYGKGNGGFYSDWWRDEDFAKEKPRAGIYEINFDKKFTNLTRKEQKEKIPEGFGFTHPAVILEAIFSHYKKTGERLLEDWYSRTSGRSSLGRLVLVGRSVALGVRVRFWLPDCSDVNLGAVFSRSLGNLNVDTLENRVEAAEERLDKLEKIFNLDLLK